MSPVIPISSIHATDSAVLELDIETRGGRYSGIFGSKPRLGQLPSILAQRDWWFIKQIGLPLFTAIALLPGAILLLWLSRRLSSSRPIIREYGIALSIWATFFLFLSGIIRHALPTIGMALHIPIRCLATLSIIRLILTAADWPKYSIQRITKILVFLLFLMVPLGFFGRDYLQDYFYVCFNFTFLYSVYCLRKTRNRTSFQNAILFTGVIAAAGYMFDSYKILSSWDSPVPYLNRYTTPPLLLTFLIFMADEFIKSVQSEARKLAFEDATLQVLHDLKSPLASLRLLSDKFTSQNNEATVLFHTGIQRISEITSSLDPNTSSKRRLKTNITNLIGQIVAEKKIEYPYITFALSLPDQPVFGRVDETGMTRAMSNLINNAVESYEHYSGEILIVLTLTHTEMEITITDKGRGLSPDMISKLNKQDPVTSTKEISRGLGLRQVFSFCKSSKGHLIFARGENRGLSVTLRIPIADD